MLKYATYNLNDNRNSSWNIETSAKRKPIYYADNISFTLHSERVFYRKHIYQGAYVDTHISNLPLAGRAMRKMSAFLRSPGPVQKCN